MSVVAAVALALTLTIIVINSGGQSPSPPAVGGSATTAPPAETPGDVPGGRGGPQGSSRALPPPTPTGAAYNAAEPAVGACVDIARNVNGLVLYEADCADSSASLVLDNVQTQRCPSKGFWGLRGFSGRILCFTYHVSVGDCVDMDLPRRAPCTPTPPTGPKGKVTVTEIHPGARDGASCNAPLFLEVGRGDQRGIGCFTPIPSASSGGASTSPAIPSR